MVLAPIGAACTMPCLWHSYGLLWGAGCLVRQEDQWGLPGLEVDGRRLPVPGFWAALDSGLCPRTWPSCPGLPQSQHCYCHHHADPQDCTPLDCAPGWGLPEPEASETPSARVPHQHHPAEGQL